MERRICLRRFSCGSDGGGRLSCRSYFWQLPAPALEKLRVLNDSGEVRMEIVTKVKKSCAAFHKPGPDNLGGDDHLKREPLPI